MVYDFPVIDAFEVEHGELVEWIRDVASTRGFGVCRNGLKRYDRDRWERILLGDCGFKIDVRQFNVAPPYDLNEISWWEISYQPDKSYTYAHSKTHQPLHTDNAWFADPAEINFFVMEKQAVSGGNSTIYPAAKLLADLETRDPGLRKRLVETKVRIQKGTTEYFYEGPIIKNPENPELHWNFHRTEKSDPAVNRLCDDFAGFLAEAEDNGDVFSTKLETGDTFCFNDLKVLHGRTAFEAEKAYDRVIYQSMWKL